MSAIVNCFLTQEQHWIAHGFASRHTLCSDSNDDGGDKSVIHRIPENQTCDADEGKSVTLHIQSRILCVDREHRNADPHKACSRTFAVHAHTHDSRHIPCNDATDGHEYKCRIRRISSNDRGADCGGRFRVPCILYMYLSADDVQRSVNPYSLRNGSAVDYEYISGIPRIPCTGP